MTPPRWLIVCVGLAVGVPLFAADPVAPLRPLIPRDAAVVFVVRNLGPQLKSLGESPMAAWLTASPLFKQFVDPKEAAKLVAARDFVAAQLGVTPAQLRDDIFGDAVVFAFQPGEPGKPATDTGTLLVAPRDPAALRRLIDGVNALQQAAGELTGVRPAERNGLAYFVRDKADKGREFYAFRDKLFVFTNREATLHAALATPAAEPAVPKWLALDDGQGTVTAMFNPRAFDAAWSARAATGPDAGDRAFHKQFAKVWAALDGLSLSAGAGANLTLRVTADIDDARLPPEWRRLLTPPARGPRVVAPADALVAVHGDFNLRTLLDVASPFLPDGGTAIRKQLDEAIGPAVGRDDLPAVLDTLGPDLTFWVRPSASAATLEAALAVRLGPSPADAARLAPPLRQALDSLAHLWRLDYNRKHADQVTLLLTAYGQSAENPRGFPAGYLPTYSLRPGSGYAVFLTRPGLSAAPTTPADDPPQLRIALAATHTYLRDHRAAVAEFLAKYEGRPAAEIDRELGNLLPVVAAGKSLEVRLTRSGPRLAATVTVEFVEPLTSEVKRTR